MLCRRLDLARCTEVTDAGVARLAAYTRQPAAASSSSEGGEADGDEGPEEEEEAVAAAVGGLQLAAGAAGAKVPAMESPDSAVKRLAAQRHATMIASSAAAGMWAAGGRAVGCRLRLAAPSAPIFPPGPGTAVRASSELPTHALPPCLCVWPALQRARSTAGHLQAAWRSSTSERLRSAPAGPSCCCSRAAPPARA